MKYRGFNRQYIFILLFFSIIVYIICRWLFYPPVVGPRFDWEAIWAPVDEGGEGLDGPVGIARMGEEIFVSDTGHHRVVVLDSSGRYIRSVGRKGKEPGMFMRPMHLYARKGQLYVADMLNDRIQVFRPDGTLIRIIDTNAVPGGFDAPAGVAVDPKGRIWVADFYNHRIVIFRPDGTFLKQLGKTKSKGTSSGMFNYPTDVDVLPDGRIVVADAYNDRIQLFTETGKFIRQWGGFFALNVAGPFRGWFRTAVGVTVDPGGLIYVADFLNHRIQVFTPEGRFLTVFGRFGRGPGAFDRPTDLIVMGKRVVVVDFGNNRLQVFMRGRIRGE